MSHWHLHMGRTFKVIDRTALVHRNHSSPSPRNTRFSRYEVKQLQIWTNIDTIIIYF